jgi:hypothetical protein
MSDHPHDDDRHESTAARAVDLRRRSLLVALIVAAVARPSVQIAAAQSAPAVAPPSAPTAADWELVLRAMFPHARVDGSLYAIPAGALVGAAEKDPATRALLLDGWSQLQSAVGGRWSTASDAARLAALTRVATAPFFGILRQTTVFTFYANPKMWEGVGYEGDAWRIGGYAGPSLDTLDWLPSPPKSRGARR